MPVSLPGTRDADPGPDGADQHYRSLVENLPLVIYTRTLEPDSSRSQALFMSGRIKAMLEIEPHEAQPGRVREMIHPDDFARVAPLYDEANRLGLPLSVDYRLVTPSGRTIWVHDESEIVRDADGVPLHAQGYLLDVTAQRTAELETERALERERAARIEAEEARASIVSTVEKISEAFMSFDRDLTFRYANAHAEELLGRDHVSLRGKTPVDVFGDKVSAVFLDALRRAAAGESVEIPEHASEAVGGIYELRAHPSPDGVWVFARDITERRRLEDSLRHAQKMEAVGQLAGGIAHDFNNLLTAISGYAGFALRDLDAGDDERVRRELAGVADASERAAELTQQLLAFGRRQVLHRRVLDLNEVVAGAERLLGRLIGEHIAVAAVTADGLPDVVADSSQLEQVIVNLAVNARDAMPGGGTLTIATSAAVVDAAEAARLDVEPGGYVSLSVSDTGTGVPSEIREQIFDPFFTTKPIGAGTGLGLATVYGIVRQSGGAIDVESTDAGATFHVYLPAANAAAEPPAPTPETGPGHGDERILFVEDEPVLRDLVPEMLASRGYSVVVAEDGASALAAADSEEFDLLITDVVMPGMSGVELADRLREQLPSIGVLFISGYTNSIVDGDRLDDTMRFLAKPFSTDEIARAARDLLAAAAPV